MTISDLPFGERLSRQSEWNQTTADWQRFFDLQPGGCFVAKLDGQLVGTVTTCVFDQAGWIGMMLVDPSARRQGVGRELMIFAMQYLESQGTETIYLDATPMGEPLYTSLGFKPQYQLIRFAGIVESQTDKKNIEHFQKPDWEQIALFDAALTGYSRRKLFSRFGAETDIVALVDQNDRELRGYVCSRPGRLAAYIGPCMARISEVAESLLRQALHHSHSQRVFVDVPNNKLHAINILESVGLKPARGLLRMCHGVEPQESAESLWASGGPTKG